MNSTKNNLFLLTPNFTDPAYPGKRFYCWHCALIEGALLALSDHSKHLQVERVAWPRPRKEIIDIVGAENQSLPLLVLAEGRASKFQTGSFKVRAFTNEKDKILAALSELYDFPEPHP